MSYYDIDRAGNAGGTQWPEPHHGMVSEYQQSGIPFVFFKSQSDPTENSIITITLPYVSRWIKLSVVSAGNTCRVGFGDFSSTKGVQGDNYIMANVLTAITTPLEIKCKVIKIFVPNGQAPVINLVAGLTNVRQFPDIEREADLSGITTSAAVSAAGQAAIYAIAAAS